jgi:hypothetical protein
MPLSENAARSKDQRAPTPSLQHRHFAFIASVIRDIPTPSARVEACAAFGLALKCSNPAFDNNRFSDACGCEPDQHTLEELDLAITHATYWLDHLQAERQIRGFAETTEAA